MSKVRSKKPAPRRAKPLKVAVFPASLPPSGIAADAVASSPPASIEPIDPPPSKKPYWDIGKESVQYEKAMKCLAMRAAGIDDKAIADALNCKIQTVWNLCYTAGKNKWAETFATARDQIEFAIMPKVVRNLERSLDDGERHQTSRVPVGTQVALAIAQGMIFERGGDPGTPQGMTTAIAIRIEMPAGLALPIREGTISGVPAYSVEGETHDADSH